MSIKENIPIQFHYKTKECKDTTQELNPQGIPLSNSGQAMVRKGHDIEFSEASFFLVCDIMVLQGQMIGINTSAMLYRMAKGMGTLL